MKRLAGLAAAAGFCLGLAYLSGSAGAQTGPGAWSAPASGTTSDHPNRQSAATPLALDSSLPGRIDPADDEDMYKIVTTEDTDLWVYTTGDLDTVGELTDSRGDVVDSNDHGRLPPAAFNFSLRAEVGAGTYYVSVRSYAGAHTGAYRVHAVNVLPVSTDAGEGTLISPDSLTPGRLERPPDPIDVFRIELTEHTDLSVFSISDFPTAGTLYDADGDEVISFDETYVPGRRPGFRFRARLEPGTYRIHVTGHQWDDAGPFLLYVDAVDDPGSSIATAVPLTFELETPGRIEPAGDQDYFSLTLAAPSNVYLFGHSYHNDRLSLDVALFDEDENEGHLNVHWSLFAGNYLLTAKARLGAGTHYFRVTSPDGRSRPYMLFPRVDVEANRFDEDCLMRGSSQSDPLYGCQWHLNNTGQYPGGAGHDINVEGVWATTMGEGVNVAVVDQGLDLGHEDLKDNISEAGSHDYSSDEPWDPEREFHGTPVAGLVAAADNIVGGRGVAPRATLYGRRLLTNTIADIADAMIRDMSEVAVSNNSWGPPDNGQVWFAPRGWEMAVERGVEDGYGGKGIFYVWAGGNGHPFDYSNFDGLASHYAVTAVCAVEHDDDRAVYSERGANLWVCAPSSGDDGDPRVTTTRNTNLSQATRYTKSFGGTSAAAPIVSGVAALLRSAHPALTWRDLKLILAGSARHNDPDHANWEEGALEYDSADERYRFNHSYGFGVVDAGAAMELADGWTSPPPWREISVTSHERVEIADRSTVTTRLVLDPYVEFVEFIAIEPTISHTYYRDLHMELTSPSGVTSVVSVSVPVPVVVAEEWVKLTPRFSSAKHLGEDAAGEWTLSVTDNIRLDEGTLHSWKLTAYGHGYVPGFPGISRAVPGDSTITVTWEAPDDLGESAITGYDLRYVPRDADGGADPSGWTVVEGAWSAGSLQHALGGLDTGARYYVGVRAVNGAGAGPWSESFAAATVAEAPGAPQITGVVPGNNELIVFWAAPDDDGAADITSYDLRYIETSADETVEANWTVTKRVWTSGDGGEYEIRVGGLQTGVGYDVEIRAVNRVDAGPWSDPAMQTPREVPGAPAVDSVTAGRQALTVEWAAPQVTGGSAITSYDVRHILSDAADKAAANWTVESGAWTSGDLAYTITGLEGGAAYDVGVRAINVVGASSWSDPVTGTTSLSDDATLSALTGVRLEPAFDSGTMSYTATVGYTVTRVTVRATSNYHRATVEFLDGDGNPLADADSTAPGHQVDLSVGDNIVGVNVTAQDGVTTLTYTVTVDRDEKDLTLTPAASDPRAPFPSGASYSLRFIGYWTDRDTPEGVPSGAGFSPLIGAVHNAEAVFLRSGGRASPGVEKMAETGDQSTLIEEFNAAVPNASLVIKGRRPIVHISLADIDNIRMTTDHPLMTLVTRLTPSHDWFTGVSGLPLLDASGRWRRTHGVDIFPWDAGTEQGNDFSSSPDAETVPQGRITSISGVGPFTTDRIARLEMFLKTVTTERTVAENTPEGGPIGLPVTPFTTSGTVNYTLGGPDRNSFDLDNSTGQLRAKPGVIYDREARPSYTVTVTCRDTHGRVVTTVNIEVRDVDEAPTISGDATVDYRENGTTPVGTYTVSDPEGASVTPLSLSGDDADDFELSDAGRLTFRLTFRNPPDYESKNSYNITLSTSDGNFTGTLDVVVTVTDVNEPPSVSGATAVDFAENGTGEVARYSAVDPEDDTITWSLAGTDRRDFEISDGELTFLRTPDFEDPDDSDDDNEYQVTVRARDGARYGTLAVVVTVTGVDEPDLVVGAPTASPSNPLTGASFTLSATVRNQGGAAAGSTLSYYRSSDATISTSDTSVGTDSVSGLGAGASSAESISLTAPATAGTYYYGACVDAVTDEFDTTNNCSAAVRVTVVAPPDLVVGAPRVSDSNPTAGTSFTLSATVRNQGGAAAGSSTLRYYRSSDATISTSDTSVGTDAVSGLGAGASSAESISVTAPATAGTNYYGACVGTVTNESDTTNNCSAAVRVTVVAPPDLVVGAPRVSDSNPTAGTSFTLSATVRNQGGAAAVVATTLRYYRSTDHALTTGDSQVGTDAVSGLGAGASSAESISLTAPSVPGTYYYGACVDAVSDESDTTNNCSAAVRVTVTAPDLVVDAPTVTDSSPVAGTAFTLSARVRNNGRGAAAGTTLRYYRSTDDTITTGDSQVGTDSVSGLGWGESSAESISVTAPASAGTYYYGACVDAMSDESDTTNNCSAAVRVTVTAPDLVVDAPTVSNSNPAVGTSFNLRATVRNQGNGAMRPGVFLRYYRSTDDTITTGDTSVGRSAVRALGAGDVSAEFTTLTAPASAGTYYYGACVDTVTNESDATNNCSVAVRVTVVTPPDLVVESTSVINSNPAAGASFTLSATVRNQGGAAAAGTTLRYYLSSDASISTSDTSVGTDSVSGLGAGASSAESIRLTAPATAGTYYYGACVGTVTDESNTTNNCSAAVAVTVGAAPAPDLVVGAPRVSDSNPAAGASFTLSATVRNQGSGAAAGTTLRYYRSSDATISTSDTSVGTDAVSGLGAGASSAESISVTAPATAGTYYYGACVGTVTDESNTTNNCSRAVAVTVGAAPVFSEGASTDRSVVENSAAGTDVGPAVTATDADNDTLTYRLEGTDAASFSIVSTSGQIQTSAGLDHEAKSSYSVTVRADDGKSGRDTIGVTISVTDVNEPPTVNGQDELTLFENDEDFSESYAASDPEGVASTFTWSVAGTDGGDFSIDGSTGELTFGNTPDYESPADANRNNEYLVTVRATEEGGLGGSLDVTVTVENVDEPPTITGSAIPPDFPENSVRSVAAYGATDPERGTIAWGLSGTDSDDFNIDQGVLTFANIPDFEDPTDDNQDNEYLVTVEATDGGNTAPLDVTVTVINSTGAEEPNITTSRPSLTFQENRTGTVYTFRARDPQGRPVTWSLAGADAGDFTISSGALTFNASPDFEDPADANRDNVYELTVVVTDEQSLTDSFDFTVTVTNHHENLEPAITTRPGSGLTYQKLNYQENRTSTVYTYRARNYGSGSIRWSLSGTDSGSFDISVRGALTFTSAPNHESPGDSGGDNDYEIVVVASNSGGYSDRLNVVITVTDVNEGPEVSGPASFTIAENRRLSNAVYSATDPEGSNVARWSVGGRDGGDFFITQGGTLYFRSRPDYERPADSNRDNVYEVTVQPSDGRNTGSYPVTVTVTDVNEPPEIRRVSNTSFTQPENRTSRLYTFSAADPEGGTVTWSVGGTDGGAFAIDERGRLSFDEDNPPDFDNPKDVGGNNLYDVTIEARDPESKTASLPVTVMVTEVDEGPVITRDGNLFGSPPGTVPEDQAVTQVLATYTASDPEHPGVRITQWSTAGRDGRDFVMNALGQLRFRNPPDFERPADSDRDNVYEVTIRASDGRNTGALEEVQTVTVRGVDEAPIITTTSRTAFALQENRTSTLYTFRATDPEGETVNWTPGGTDGSAFTIDERGALSFANPPDFESPTDSGGDNVYNVTVQARDAAFNTAGLDIVVTVTDHNEGVEPTITTRRPPATYRENGTSAVYTFRASDPQRGTTITWTLEGTDRGDFTLSPDSSGRGVLAFASPPPPDFENPADAGQDNVYELAVVATDDDGHSDRVDFAITVTDDNEGVEPTISTRRPPATYRENDTRTVYTFRASDPQRDPVTWSLSGADSGDFTITGDNSGRGVLAFNSPPDFESPADADQDNAYELAVVATDGDGHSDQVDFAITVTDINEGPRISLEGTATTTVAENTPDTQVLADYTARDPENPGAEIYRWSTTGRDGGDFVISDLGELRFRFSPDYERPADSDRDNVYEVTVRASDGRSYGMSEMPLEVTVAQVNEAPVITTTSRTEFSLRENSTSIIYTYRATDQDTNDVIRWSLEGADGGDFAIYNGMVTFRLLPDLENPVDADEDNVYQITVVAVDEGGLRDTVDAVITITDQSEGPVIAGTTSYIVAENYDIAQVLESYTATDAKDNRPVHPRWSLSGRDGGDFTINDDGELAFRNIPDYDRPADSDRDNVYEVTVRGHDSRAYGNLNVTVTVTPVNEHDPVVTGRETLSFRENTTGATRLHTYRATDGDRDTSFTWSVEGDDGDDFAIDEGVLTFRAPPDYEQPADSDTDNVYQVTVVASDGTNQGTLGVAVTVTGQNEGPVVSGTAEFTVVENRDLPNAVYTARDPEAVGGVTTAITWRLSGRDGGDFTIDRETGVLTFRTPPDHERPADANRDNVYEVTVRAYDGRNYGDFEVRVTVEDVAEITGPAALSQEESFEGGLATYSAAGWGILDVEPSWRLSGTDSGDFTIDRESGELTFRSIPDHERPADSNRDNVYSFAVQVSDGSYHGTLDVTVTVTAVDEPPAVTGRDSLRFRENTPVTTRLYTYRATDPEGDGFTWRLGGLDASDFGIGQTGVLTFATPPDFDRPGGSGAHGNEYLVTVQARDAQGNTGEFPVTVTVTDVNEGPEISGTQSLSFDENTATDRVLATYSASDPEGQPFTRWSLSGSDGGDFLISENGDLTFRNTPDYDRPADSNRDNEYRVTVRAHDGRTYGRLEVTIAVSNQNEHDPVIRSGSRTSFSYREEGTSALYTYSATDGDKDDVITWATGGTDGSLFEFDDRNGLVFREPPDYEDPGDSGQDNGYELTVVATDSGGRSASLSVTVTVAELNEGPEVSGTATYTVPEGQDLTGAAFTARDPEDAGAAVTSWRLAGSDAGDFTITDTGQNSARLTFRNTPDYDRPADSNRDSEYLVTIRAYNGSTYGSLDVTVTVTDQNEAEPVVTGRDTLSFRENTATGTRLYTYRATDTDRGATITWSVGGTDGGNFTISIGGELFFSSIPDHEQAADSDSDNVYDITVVASDGSNEGTLAVAVTVTDVNEGPEIFGAQSLDFAENTATDRVLASYTGTDPEDPTAEIARWSVTGRDGGDFSVNEGGELTFRNLPDHERPADSNRDNVYEVIVRASDGRVYGTHHVTVTVTAVDEAPEFRRGSRDSFSYRENGTSALYTYRATDPEGAEVAWSVSGADRGDFGISDTGVLAFREPPDHDDPADDDQDNEYQVTVVATDQTGHAADLPVTVTVTDVNEGPVIADTGTNTAITVQENHDQVLATYTATDPEDPNLEITRWSVTGRDGGDFSINEGGELTFRNPPDHERPADSNRDNEYEVAVRASDGRYYGTLDAVVTVEAVDEAPEIAGDDAVSYKENGTASVATYRATDPEGSGVTWGLSGTDSSAFTMSETGVLSFNSPPDYESPADSGSDNVYLVTVEARDDQSSTARLAVTVTVTNVTDLRAPGGLQVTRHQRGQLKVFWNAPDSGPSPTGYTVQWKRHGADWTDKDDVSETPVTDTSHIIEGLTDGVKYNIRVIASTDDTDSAPSEEATATPGETTPPGLSSAAVDGARLALTFNETLDSAKTPDQSAFAVTVEGDSRGVDAVAVSGSVVTVTLVTAVFSGDAVTVDYTAPTDGSAAGLQDPAGNAAASFSGQSVSNNTQATDRLTATASAVPESHDGHFTFEVRFSAALRDDFSDETMRDHAFTVTGGTVTRARRLEPPSTVGWEIHLMPDGDGAVTIALPVTTDCTAEGAICTGYRRPVSNRLEVTVPGPPSQKPSQENSPATGAPAITGTAQLGETLTANTSGVIDADGLSNVQYEYQWLADDTDIAGATGSTYTLTDGEEGKTVKVQVSFTDGAGNDETLTSAATAAVATAAVAAAEPSEPPAKPTGLSATASHDTVTLTWDDPNDDSITGYVILRRNRDTDREGEFRELVADTGSAAATYTDDNARANTPYTYRIKAINKSGVSERSRWVHVETTAAPTPEHP